MDDPLKFRCSCRAEYAISRVCPKCGQRSDPTHYQLADLTWIDRDSWHVLSAREMKPDNIVITEVNLFRKKTYSLKDCPPKIQERLLQRFQEKYGTDHPISRTVAGIRGK